jgi:hypothetical protein
VIDECHFALDCPAFTTSTVGLNAITVDMPNIEFESITFKEDYKRDDKLDNTAYIQVNDEQGSAYYLAVANYPPLRVSNAIFESWITTGTISCYLINYKTFKTFTVHMPGSYPIEFVNPNTIQSYLEFRFNLKCISKYSN